MLRKFWEWLYAHYWDTFWSAFVSSTVTTLAVLLLMTATADGKTRSCYIEHTISYPKSYYTIMRDIDWRDDKVAARTETIEEAKEALKVCEGR